MLRNDIMLEHVISKHGIMVDKVKVVLIINLPPMRMMCDHSMATLIFRDVSSMTLTRLPSDATKNMHSQVVERYKQYSSSKPKIILLVYNTLLLYSDTEKYSLQN